MPTQNTIPYELWGVLNAVRVVMNFSKPRAEFDHAAWAYEKLADLLPRMNEVLDKCAADKPLPDNITLHTLAEVELKPEVLERLAGDLAAGSVQTITFTMEKLGDYVIKNCDDSDQRLAEHQCAAVDACFALKGKCSAVTFYYKSRN